MNRVLLSIGGLLVGLLALLFVAPVIVDWNRYRGIFEEEATRFLGREVRVGGEINLRLLPTPYVGFQRVRIADTEANVGKPLFMANNLTVRLSIGALLAGGIEASAVELTEPVVTLVLDDKGGGSWSGLAPSKLAPSLGATHIGLDAVHITAGKLQILDATGRPRAIFDQINGELSAATLEGPYKVSAAYTVGGRPREVRLSTSAPAGNGAVRTKGTVRAPATGLSYTVDGDLHDLFGKTSFGGQLTARLPLPSVIETAAATKPAENGKRAAEFDVRAEVAADTTGLKLKDLSLSFEQEGRPQLASGEASVTWAESTEVHLSLSSQWLDLDHITGNTSADTPPLKLLQTLANGLSHLLTTEEGRTVARLSIDQASLGKDVVSGLAATLEQVKNKLQVRGLTASLPGGTRLSADGTFEIAGPTPRYDGKINLRGGSLARFMGWAAPGRKLTLTRADNTFALVGEVSLAANAVSGRNVTLRIGRNALTGSAGWKDGATRELSMDLEGSELDLSVLFDGEPVTLSSMAQLAARLSGATQPAAQATPAEQPVDADVRLRVGQLRANTFVFRDALADLKLSKGQLTLTDVRLNSDEGYTLELRGDITGFASPEAKGELTAYLAADKHQGLAAAVHLLALPSDFADSLLAEDRAQFMVPARLAGRLQLGSRGSHTRDLSLDGDLGQTRLAGTIRLARAEASWRNNPTDFALTLEGTTATRLLAGLALPAGFATPAAPIAASPAQLTIRALGAPHAGMTSLVTLAAPGANARYDGRIQIDDTAGLGLSGALQIDAADLPAAMQQLGLAPSAALSGPVRGEIRLERTAGRLSLVSDRLVLAGATLGGKLLIDKAVTGAYRLVGDIKSDRASFPGLLTYLTQSGKPVAEAAPPTSTDPAAVAATRSAWSESPLDLTVLDRVAGSKLRLEIGRLALTPDIQVSDARLDVITRAAGLDLRLMESDALGGRASGMIALDKAPAGATLQAEGRVSGASLTQLAASPASAAMTGTFAMAMKGKGTALTPRGLIVALTGAGELALQTASLKRWNPAAVGSAAEAVISQPGEIAPGTLRQQLDLGLTKGGGLSLGSQRIPIRIADGALRSAPLTVQSQDGNVYAQAMLDIDAQRLHGQLRIEAKAPPPTFRPLPPGLPRNLTLPTPPHKPELPSIMLTYSGALARLAAIEPELDIAALEREVTVRKVEREVVELERMRRIDEELARLNAERRAEQQRIDEQRAAAGQPPLPQQLPADPQAQPGQQALPVAPATPLAPPQPGTGTVPLTENPAGPPSTAAPAAAADTPLQGAQPTAPQATPAPPPTRPAAAPRQRTRRDPFESLRNQGGG